MQWRLADQFARIGIRENQACIARQNLRREIRRDREEQRIAVLSVLRPFLIGTVVGNARLDLNNPDVAIAPDSQHVGAAAVAERDLAQTFEVESAK